MDPWKVEVRATGWEESASLVYIPTQLYGKQSRSTKGCSKLKRSVDMRSSGKNGVNL